MIIIGAVKAFFPTAVLIYSPLSELWAHVIWCSLNMHLNFHPGIWFCMKWHDIVCGCMVYTEHAKTAEVSHGTSHVTNQTELQVHLLGGYSKHAQENEATLTWWPLTWRTGTGPQTQSALPGGRTQRTCWRSHCSPARWKPPAVLIHSLPLEWQIARISDQLSKVHINW